MEDAYCYATIIVKRPLLLAEQRLHTYRTNWTLLLFASDSTSETGDYTGTIVYCQAHEGFLWLFCDFVSSKESRDQIPDPVADATGDQD